MTMVNSGLKELTNPIDYPHVLKTANWFPALDELKTHEAISYVKGYLNIDCLLNLFCHVQMLYS